MSTIGENDDQRQVLTHFWEFKGYYKRDLDYFAKVGEVIVMWSKSFYERKLSQIVKDPHVILSIN